MVLVRNLPSGIREPELRVAAELAMRRLPLARIRYRPKVREVKILKVLDGNGRVLKYHGLLRIAPPAFARRFVERISSLSVEGWEIPICPYFPRERDRRIAYTDPRLLPFRDRRKRVRRRLNLRPLA